MKKLLGLLALGLALIGGPALAANCSTYPYTLTNGQSADANQVMANFNSILSCANTNLLPSPLTSGNIITGLGYTPLDVAGSNSMTGQLTLVTGTTILTSIVLPPGTLNMTPVSGAIENDGTSFYVVNSGAARKKLAYADGSNFATAYAPLASPALTGVPTAPTASAGTSTTQLATTAFVIANSGSGAPVGTPTCGMNCASVTGSNSSMTVTQTASTDSFVVDFSTPWTNAPRCVFAPASAAAASLAYQTGTTYMTTTTGAVTFNNGLQTTSTPITWIIYCQT